LNNAGNTGDTAVLTPHNIFIKGAGTQPSVTTVVIYSSIGSSGGGIVISNSIASGSVLLAGVLGPQVTGVFQNVTNINSVENLEDTTNNLKLSGANTYAGGTTIYAGGIQLGAANAIPAGSSVTNNGTLDLNTFSDTINGLSGAGFVDTVAGGAPTLTVGAGNAGSAFSGVIKNTAGTLSLAKTGSGAFVLSGSNTYTGPTTIANGTLLVTGSIGTNSLFVNTNATLGGTGKIAGPVQVQPGGNFAPGAGVGAAGAVLTLGSNLMLDSGSLTTMKVHTGNKNDQAVSSGAVTYGGALVLTTNAGDPPLAAGDTFILFAAASYTGNFASLNLPTLGSGLIWSNSLSSHGTLAVVAGTISPAVVTNLPPSNVQAVTATLNGQVVSTGNQVPTVILYYGPANGGTNPAAWSQCVALGAQSGSFGCAVSGLSANAIYYYTAAASNSAGTVWAAPSQSVFIPVSVPGFMPPQLQIMSDMMLANSNFTNNWPVAGCSSCLPGGRTSAEWTRGTYMEGALALYRINPNLNLYDYDVQWGALFEWQLSYGDLSTDPDGQCAGQQYIELYDFDPIPANTNYLTHILNNVTYWVSNNIGLTAWSYVDAIHMSMPAYAKLAALNSNTTPALNNNAAYPAEMYAWFHQIKSVLGASNGLYNTTDHLWWRDTTFLSNYVASDGTAQKCYWSRGNGWALVALCRTMDVLPASDPHFSEYLQTFQDMSAAIKAVQRPDGFWNVNLACTNDYPGPEASGTACFVYGMAWGINKGWLASSNYLPAVISGWNALANGALHRTADTANGAGFLGYEQDAGDQPSSGQPVTYDSVPVFTDFGLGLFLLAGSAVYDLSTNAGITLDPPVVTGNQVRLNFTVISSLTNATINLLQTSQLGGNWTTNTSATFSTNLAGESYGYTTTNSAAAMFYRIEISP
jgi:autotransporter-associated beta strand protein